MLAEVDNIQIGPKHPTGPSPRLQGKIISFFCKIKKVSSCLLKSTSPGTLAPARELGGDGKADVGPDELEQRIMYFLTNLNLVVPVVAALAVIIIAIIVICVLRSRNNNISKG